MPLEVLGDAKMRKVLSLPPAFDRFKAMGGALDFAVFEDADGTTEEILSAVPHVLHKSNSYDHEKLRLLGSQRITEQIFFGDRYDYATGLLLLIRGGLPSDGPGQFSYAFSNPPYTLTVRRSGEVQTVFNEIQYFIILPAEQVCEIADWSNT
jgi:hypothetical protein